MNNLLEKSCSSGTWRQYNSVIIKWNSFCKKRCENTYPLSINPILEFLASLYTSGLSYSSINTARSALSLHLGKIDNVSVGNHPLVVRIMKGVSNSRPVSCKYNTIWDANLVLKCFELWDVNSNLSLLSLSIKLCALLALTTSQRCQTLAAIKISNIRFLENQAVDILITDRLKTSRFQSNTVLSLPSYSCNSKLCPVQTLKDYMSRTEIIRKEEQYLFLHHINERLVSQ